ncbi:MULTISPECIES: SIR2 family protein [Lysinibacillus]|uniref:Uncharacterized protein n=1 Tax=Lysinibacillus fusiformis TaxID=28031 RepID=A0A1E4R794_9BACI|nr:MULTISPECIES: SIR2 family protein [Lysinibacillus]ODV56331.1 hypothetical protein BG258_10675 [Lysinibacillus fusiformis]
MNKTQYNKLLPDSLQKNIKMKSCGFFIGAGISVKSPTNLPGWKKLLKDFVVYAEKNKELEKDIIEQLYDSLTQDKLLEVAEYLQGNLKESYTKFLTGIFDNEQTLPNQNHKLLAKIESPLFITTNYDKLIENSMIKKSINPIVSTANNNEKLEQIHNVSLRQKILKIHGNIDDTETLVLSETDYMKTLNNQMLNVILNSYFHRYSFVFVGCSMTDPDVLIFLKKLKSIFNGYSPKHYALVRKGSINIVDQYIYKKIYNIEFLFIDKHDDVTDFLQHTVALQKPPKKVNPCEEALKIHSKLNHMEYLLYNMELMHDDNTSYDDTFKYDEKYIEEDLKFAVIKRNTFDEFKTMDLINLISYPESDFLNVYNMVNNLENDISELVNNPQHKAVLCDSLNDTKDNLTIFIKEVRDYILRKRLIVNDEIIKEDKNETMLSNLNNNL